RPRVRHVTEAPPRRDAEPDLSGRVILRDHEPLAAALEVTGERVVAEAKRARVFVALVLDVHDLDAAEIVQTQDLELEQHVPTEQWRRRIEVRLDDRWIRERVRVDGLLRPFEQAVR